MNYHQGRQRKNSHLSLKKALIIAAAVIVFYLSGSFLGKVSGPISVIFYPFVKLSEITNGACIGVSGFFSFRNTLIKENSQLKQKNNLLSSQLADRQSLENDNQELRNMLSLPIAKLQTFPAEVLSKPSQTPYDVILISASGTAAVGRKVFAQDTSIILGTVVSLNALTAKVKLFSSPGENIPIVIGSNNTPSVASGLGNGNFVIQLPRDVAIKEGDIVKTSLIGQYTLGLVGKIDSRPSDPFQKVYVKIPLNLYELRWVQISKI